MWRTHGNGRKVDKKGEETVFIVRVDFYLED